MVLQNLELLNVKVSRSTIGEFTVHQAATLDQIKSLADIENKLFLLEKYKM